MKRSKLHSGCADTVMASLPPVDIDRVRRRLRDTWHFTGDGPVEVLDLDSQPRDRDGQPKHE